MDESPLTELQIAVLETEEMGLPRRDAMRLATQRVGYFIGQQRYTEELNKALKTLEGRPASVEGTETARADSGHERRVPGPPPRPRSATHQIGSTGG